MAKKVSLIIPAYNAEKSIGQAIASALLQSYCNLEIIVVDDGSHDKTSSICKDYAEKNSNISYYYKKNGGVSSARNFGIEKASGEYIVFLDSDDLIDRYVVENLMNNYRDDELTCVRTMRVGNNCTRELNRKKVYDASDFVRSVMSDDLQGFVWGYIFKRSANVRFDERVKYCEDIAFMVEYINKNDIKTIRFLDNNCGYYYYRYDADSITNSKKNLPKKIKEIDAAMRIIRGVVTEKERLLVDNREFELLEPIMMHLKGKKEIQSTLKAISLPNYTGNLIHIKCFAHLCHHKNIYGLAIYYAMRKIIKRFVNLPRGFANVCAKNNSSYLIDGVDKKSVFDYERLNK